MLDNLFAPDKLLLIALVGLVLFGPKRLPQIGRSVGRWLGEFRRAAGGLGDELKAGMHSEDGAPAEATATQTVTQAAEKPAASEPGPTPPATQ